MFNKRKLTIRKRAESKGNNNYYNDYRNPLYDITGVLFLIIAGILLLSYFSMNMEDVNSNGNEIKNILGIFGAYISVYSFLAFGYSHFIIPAFFIYAGINIILKNSFNKLLASALGSSILMILLSVSLYIFNGSCGTMGNIIGLGLTSLFGKAGAFIIVMAGLLIVSIVFAKFSILDLINYFNGVFRKIDLNKIKNFEDRIVKSVKNRTYPKTENTASTFPPLFYKKEISELSSIPFVEKINDCEFFDEADDDYFYKSVEEDEEVESIVNGLKKNDIMDSEEDIGIELAKAAFGKNYYKNVDSSKPEIPEYYDEEDFNIGGSSALDFKKAIYDKTAFAKYDKTDNFIKANHSSYEDYDEYLLRNRYKEDEEETNDYDDIKIGDKTETQYGVKKHNEEYNKKKEEILSRLKNIVKNSKESKEYLSINDDSDKPFEFGMGYASKREYDRSDHIPGIGDKYLDYKLEDFDLDEEELYNIDDDPIEDVKIRELNDGFMDEKKNNNVENINSLYEINDIKNENYGFINMESEKKVNTINGARKSVIAVKRTVNDLDLIQSNFDTKYVDKRYKSPPFDLLNRAIPINDNAMLESIKQTAMQLENTLQDFNIETKVVGVSRGPVITRYELELAAGTKVSKISNLTDNIALALASESVRIIAPIPGRSVIGIEIPNKVRNAVYLREVLESADFRNSKLDIPFVLGKGIYGNNVVSDMSDAPHLLVAGTTGSGKSVCLSTIILSLLYKFRPDELKFIFVDKKRVELSIYNGIPHLMSPVVSDEKKATIVLRYIVDIMEKRYERMERFFVRNVKTYNEKVKQLIKEGETEFNGEPLELFPYIVLVIDELHNLMVVASKEVEDLISRLAGMSRAVGIHLIIATQRPSADVVTGVIKANLPTRIAFQVPNKTNSRIIIDMSGAEQLLGKGDALFCASGSQMPERIQGAFVSDNEVKKVVDYLSGEMSPMFDESLIAALEGSDGDDRNSDEEDILDEELWEDAVKLVARTGKASASFLQRRLKIGYNRAARIVEIMERQGIVGPENGSKPREVLITLDE